MQKKIPSFSQGRYPSRGAVFDVIASWRATRPDLFPETKGVIVEDGVRWGHVRSQVQQDLMRPQSAMYFVDQMQEVTKDFAGHVRRIRRATNVMPDDFIEHLYKYGKLAEL